MSGKKFYSLFERPQPVTTYGKGNGAWNVQADRLDDKSTVISVGVGHDISFDLALHAQFGCKIFLFDPSPTGQKTILAHEPLPEGMAYQAVGLSDKDGDIIFAEPLHPDEGSYRLAGTSSTPASHTFKCKRLKSILSELHIASLDLLKLDIEGFEYAVLDDVLRTQCPIRQICVEFHHGIVPGITRWQSLLAILHLRRAGFSLINHEGLNFTFLKK